MKLIGIKVKHTVFGVGTIIEKYGNHITVEFATKTTKFVYPDAFEKFIKAEDPLVHQAIEDDINNAKAVAEQKRQAERKAAEEQRRAAVAVAAPKAKKSKTLDEMFAPDYHAEKLARQPILTYHQWRISLVFAFLVSAEASIRQIIPLF